jgi:hypothetical protein
MSGQLTNHPNRHRACALELLEHRRMLSLTPTGIEVQANNVASGAQTAPAAAMDAVGNYVLAWQSTTGDGDNTGIVARRFDATGIAQGLEFPVNSFTTGAQSVPAVAMDGDGDFVVVWHSFGQDGDNLGVYAQRFNPSGVPQGSEFKVNTHTTNHQRFAAVAMDAPGNFVVAWESVGQDGSGEGIYAQRYDATGAAQGGEFRINVVTALNQSAPTVAMDALGEFVVAWEDSTDGGGTGVYARRYDALGVAQDTAFRVNTITTGNQQGASAAMDADGDFVIAWQSYGQDGAHFGIYARRYSQAGAAQADEFLVNTTTTGAQQSPHVSSDDAGNFVVAWQSADANGNGIFLQGYFASGEPNDIELPANTETGSVQSAATVATNADGDLVVAWQSFGQDGNSYGIFARRYRALGGVTSASFNFDSAPHELTFTFDGDYPASITTADILLENLTTLSVIPADDLLIAAPSTQTVSVSYVGGGGVASGALPDGNYRATLLAAGIQTTTGMPLPADYVLDFFFLSGDANHDRRVDVADLGILATNWQQSDLGFTGGNFDYSPDGLVGVNDLGILATNWQQIVSQPAPVAPLGSTRRSQVQRIASDVLASRPPDSVVS